MAIRERVKTSLKIADYLHPKLIAFTDFEKRDEVIGFLVDLLEKEGYLPRIKDSFKSAIFQREELISTGIGLGVAIPHAKLQEFTDFFIAIAIQQKKGIDWQALDKAPVRFVFMIGGPEEQQTEYLQILSLLTSAIREADLRKKLLHAKSPQEVIDFFSHL